MIKHNQRCKALKLLIKAKDFCFETDFNGRAVNIVLAREINQFLEEIKAELEIEMMTNT